MGQVPLFWDVDELLGEPGIGITAASLAKEAGCDNFEPRSCKWILEGEGEISDINEIVAVVAAVSYCAFYLAERSISFVRYVGTYQSCMVSQLRIIIDFIKIGDLGVARFMSTNTAMAETVVGTP